MQSANVYSLEIVQPRLMIIDFDSLARLVVSVCDACNMSPQNKLGILQGPAFHLGSSALFGLFAVAAFLLAPFSLPEPRV